MRKIRRSAKNIVRKSIKVQKDIVCFSVSAPPQKARGPEWDLNNATL